MESAPYAERLPQDLGGGAHVQAGECLAGGRPFRRAGRATSAAGRAARTADAVGIPHGDIGETAGLRGQRVQLGELPHRVEARLGLGLDQQAGQAEIDGLLSDGFGKLASCPYGHCGFASVCPAACSELDRRTGCGGTRRPATRSVSATLTIEPSLVRIVRQ